MPIKGYFLRFASHLPTQLAKMPSSLLEEYLYDHSQENSKPFREAVKEVFKFTDIYLVRDNKNRLVTDYIDQTKYTKA